ncbi:MAG: hypothetical protein K9H64_15690 [Bacteroidales bacterium]|nr:hypothetical protein [Bacteroidales bacterium]MCF8457864.1 hypothetical protein [Bacteroidales bacterium]
MKNTLLLLLIALLSFSGTMAQSSKKSRSLKPTNYQKRVTTIVAEKSRNYYSLDNEKASVITLQGPGKLRVLTRGRFEPKQGDKIEYEILYTIDGGEQMQVKMSKVVRSKIAKYKNTALGVPADSKDFEIDLGRGYHNIEFKLTKNDIPVAVRYVFTPTKAKKQDWIAFSPLQPSEPVDLISREEAVGYYRFSTDKPMKVEVNGPTELRILTRIEYQYQMKGRIDYRLQVKENGKAINTYQLSSVRSEIAVYKTDKELVPGKAREFVIIVPKGRHTYEIVPLDKDKNKVLGRILLPKKAVKLKND